jgi:fido (protein-threonine AMPylation protein)
MDDFVKWMNQTQKLVDERKYSATEFAAKTYQRFVSIHPFFDGNGRTGRLLMDQVLLRNKLPPAVFNSYDETMVAVFGLKKENPAADVGLLVSKVEDAVANAKKILSGEKKIKPKLIPKPKPAAQAPTRRIENPTVVIKK